jgi:hypothetical protein
VSISSSSEGRLCLAKIPSEIDDVRLLPLQSLQELYVKREFMSNFSRA